MCYFFDVGAERGELIKRESYSRKYGTSIHIRDGSFSNN